MRLLLPKPTSRWASWAATATLGSSTLFLAACTPGAYSFDFFREMHYQQSTRMMEPRRVPPPSDSVPRTGARPHITFSEARDLQNPIRRTDENVRAAADLFKVNCAMCHGAAGDGKSLIADRFAAQRTVPPADLASSRVRNRTDGELNWMITNGLGGMPPFRDLLTDEQVWSLVLQTRTLQGQR
ncbi:MAG: cytochrome c [Chloroflexi bacterium]|nr:cytochrome c [Chloroflexota bacterium]